MDHKSDIYSLGLILAEVLFGQHPYFNKGEWEEYKRICQQYEMVEIEASVEDRRRYHEE